MGLHALCINSDFGGCYIYRIKIPFAALKKYDVEITCYPYLPHDPLKTDLETLLNFVYPYDFVIVQRCFRLPLTWALRQVCDILGKKIVFETDDDYLHIPPHNPAVAEMLRPGAIQEFQTILQLADLVTVSTEELKNIYYPFNKNIVVFPNNVEEVHYFKDAGECPLDEENRFSPHIKSGFVHIPTYLTQDGAKKRLIRLGYTGTITHQADFETIKPAWFRTIKQYQDRLMTVYIGDKYFHDLHFKELGGKNLLWIPPMEYTLYYYNLRNLDIGIAPLEPNIFNMSKSPVKALEYGSWGIPAVLPNYITYDREFLDNETCLMYNTMSEFSEQLARLITDVDLRKKIGSQSRAQVANRRVEYLPSNCKMRFEVYQNLVNTSRPIKIFEPKGEVNVKGSEEVQTVA